MTKYHNQFVQARLVPSSKNIHQMTVSTAVRPVRLAFLINTSVARETLSKLIEYNSVIWGGCFNLMIPTDGRIVRDDWFESLLNHEPDLIVLVGDMDRSLVEQVFDQIQPYYFHQWSDDILDRLLDGEDTIPSLSISHMLAHIYNTSQQLTSSNIRMPQILFDSIFYFHAVAQLGKFPRNYEGYCVNQLKGQFVQLADANLKGYLLSIKELSDKLTPIRITGLQLSTSSSSLGLIGFTIVLSENKFIEDFCLFWNLRAEPNFRRENFVFLPASSLNSNQNIADLAEYCNETIKGTNYIVLASASLSKSRLLRIKERIAPFLDANHIELIDIHFANFVTGKYRVYEQDKREDVTFEDEIFRLRNMEPNIESRLDESHWIIDVQLDAEGYQPMGFLPPKFSQLNSLLSGEWKPWIVKVHPGYSVRIANGYLSYRANSRTEFHKCFIPPEKRVFQSLLQSYKYSSVLSDKCRYAQGMINLFGGIEEIVVLRDMGLQELLNTVAQVDDVAHDKGYTLVEMLSYYRPGKDKKARKEIINSLTTLALKKILLRGYKIRCPACDLERWYSLSDVAETMECAGCLTEIQPSIEANFSYRLNDLIVRGVRQGCIPVLLTLLFLQKLARNSFLFVPGVIATKRNSVDIDIIASCDGHLILVECKDLRRASLNDLKKDIYSQLLNTIDIAKDIGASLVFLSTMMDSIPEKLVQQVESLNKQLKGRTVLHILTHTDLQLGYKTKSHSSSSSATIEANLIDFLPRKIRAKKGWVEAPGARSVSF